MPGRGAGEGLAGVLLDVPRRRTAATVSQRVVMWSVDGWPMASVRTINSRAGHGRYPLPRGRDRPAVPLYVGAHAPVPASGRFQGADGDRGIPTRQ